MKTKRYYYILITLLFIGGISFIFSCDKEKDINLPQTNRLTIETDSVKSVLYHTAIAYGSIGELKNITIQQYGHCWDTIEIPTIESNKSLFTNLTSHSTFISNLDNLIPAKKYYVRSYAKTASLTAYSEISSFTTKPLEPPTLTSDSIRDITSTTVKIWGAIKLDGGTTISARGVCWGTAINPTLTSQHAETNSLTNVYSTPITGLTRNTLYHVRVYATNQSGTSYGNNLTFTTNAELPQITTTAIIDITANTATGGGNITSDGSSTITARGVCWSLNESPTLSNSHTTDGSGSGIFSSNITGLQAGKTYYVRAYATNSVGTVFGNQQSFTTPAVLPTVTTTNLTDITATTATSGGNVTDGGGAPITARGVCWSTLQNPTIGDASTNNGSGEGVYSSNLIGLIAGTTYYVRAYATNSIGTAYGSNVEFITYAELPIVTTITLSNITSTSVVSSSEVISSDGAPIVLRGICWNTSPMPTIEDLHTSDGNSLGVFNSNIGGLSSATRYYVRAYATNIKGTSYGNELSFTTLLSDYDGNFYNTIQIGNQIWMKENLKTTHYNDGTIIPNITNISEWLTLNSGAYCWYNNDISNKNNYGALYNFYSIVENGKLCPLGWHVPTDDEWTLLTNYLGGENVAGGKLKEAGTLHWLTPNTGATNETGFTALPCGGLYLDGAFKSTTTGGNWWSSSLEGGTNWAWFRFMGYSSAYLFRSDVEKTPGFSVRCIKN